MTFPPRCISTERPFFRLLLSFQSMLTINRSCQSFQILHFIRSYFSLLKTSLPILLHEVFNNEEILLTNEKDCFIEIHSGIYLAFIQYDEIRYQPLFDFTFVPKEIFPEKKFLPKTSPFVIYDRNLFVKLLSNMIEYMKEYEKTKVFTPKYLPRVFEQILPIKKIHRVKSTLTQTISSPELSQTPLSTSSTRLISTSHYVDIRKYIVTDVQRLNNNSSPFSIQILNHNEQIFPRQRSHPKNRFLSITENHQFNENDLVLFKQYSFPSFPLDLKNCIHQLALDQKLDNPEVCDILLRLDHQVIHDNDIPKLIQNLQNAASIPRKDMPIKNLSILMKILLRIDQLGKLTKLNPQQVRIFNERMIHLARMGILNQQTKMLKKLSQLDLFEMEPNQENFSQFIQEDLQHIIPKQIPLNSLGIKEILHQLHININRLGVVPTLILIDNLQQINHTGLFLNLNKFIELKRYLIQFIEHIQTGRCIGVYLQRLVDQMYNSLQIPIVKKVSFTNQMNSLLQKAKLKSKSNYEQLVSDLFDLAYQGKLNTFTNKNYQLSIDLDDNHLQSLLLFLHEQSSLNLLPNHLIIDFISYLRHYAQLGILDEPILSSVLTYFYRAKDENNLSIDTFKNLLIQLNNVDYLYTYHHLNFRELNEFFHEMIYSGNLTSGQVCFVLDRLVDLYRNESITNNDIDNLLYNLQLEYHRQQAIYPKLIELFDNLIESYSQSIADFHLFERDLEKCLLSMNFKRIPEDFRKRLNEIIIYSKQIRTNPVLVEKINTDVNICKSYNKIKEIMKNKNLINRKQSLADIVQVHKYFLQLSHLQAQTFLTDQQLDSIFQNIQIRCEKQHEIFEETIENMAKLGYLQDRTFVDYLTEHFLANDISSFSSSKCSEIRIKLQTWLLTVDLNHSNVRPILKHLTQLENQNRIDSGTRIEIQNGLNHLVRLGKWSSSRIQTLVDNILQYNGKKWLADRNGFQLIQSYRFILNDILHAIEIEVYLERLVSEHRISDEFYYYYRNFVYRILQNDLSSDELSSHREEMKEILSMKYQDIEKIKRFIRLLPKNPKQFYPLTLSDKLFERLKYDGKIIDQSIRDQLLKFERNGILSNESFDEIFHRLYRTGNLSSLLLEHQNTNQLFFDLFDKLNILVNDGSIDLNRMIDLKEQVYLLEEMIASTDLSKVITFESRLFYVSDREEFENIANQLNTWIHREQFHRSKAVQLISQWHLKDDGENVNEKQIIKLFHELADLNRLYSTSTISILNRYLSIKQMNSTNYRNLIKDLQRLKTRALIDRQVIECIRSIEIQLYKIDSKKRFHELIIKKLENHFQQTFHLLSRPFESSYRNEISKKLTELAEIFIKSDIEEEHAYDEFITAFDTYVAHMKEDQRRSSKLRFHIDSNSTIPSISPSLKSLQSI